MHGCSCDATDDFPDRDQTVPWNFHFYTSWETTLPDLWVRK
jgi:hypothetical protein